MTHPFDPALPFDHALPFDWAQAEAFLARVSETDDLTGATRCDLADVVADLTRLRLEPGTPVVLSVANGRPFLQLYLGVLLSGGVPLAVSPSTSSARVAALAHEVGAGAVIAARLDPARFGRTGTMPAGPLAAVRLVPVALPPREPGTVLMLTSGTSGLFSVVRHRAGSLWRNAARHAQAVGLRADDVLLVTLPLFYSYAIVAQALAAMVTGARLIVSGPPFSPPAYPDQLARHAVTSSSITPTIARLLLHRGEKLPHDLRMLTVGGDQLAARHVERLRRALPRTELYLTYGLTEAGPRVTTLAAHAEPAHRFGSVGLPLPGTSTSLRDTGADGAGELLVHTDTALLAKTGGSPGTDGALVAPGVVATRDRFRIDDDGYHRFAGRLSDFVVVRGEKVSLAGVRAHVQSLPGVASCRTETFTDPDGYAQYELTVELAWPGSPSRPDSSSQLDSSSRSESSSQPSEAEVRRTVLAFLLPAERPRSLTVRRLDPAGTTFLK